NGLFKFEKIKVNEIIAIDDLKLADKAVTCVLGQSGSGKSTLRRLLNNLNRPDKGEMLYQGQSLEEIDQITLRRKITMDSQTPVIFEGTIRDNLLIGLQFSEQDSVSDEVLKQILNRISLHKELNMDAADLSGGEQQRLALARVLLLDAEVFLLDEPSSALDDTTANNVIQTFVEQITKDGNTIIMVTHDKKLADLVADYMVCMDDYSLALPEKEGV